LGVSSRAVSDDCTPLLDHVPPAAALSASREPRPRGTTDAARETRPGRSILAARVAFGIAMQTELVAPTLAAGGRTRAAGAPGTGKSTLAAALAGRAARAGTEPACAGCDPGSPAFGAPGAACAGISDGDGWRLVDVEPICSLDAARFRLPLAEAVGALLERAAPGPCVLDAPGTIRGAAAAELIAALARSARADLVVLLERGDVTMVAAALRALGVRVVRMPASSEARAPGERARARHRT